MRLQHQNHAVNCGFPLHPSPKNPTRCGQVLRAFLSDGRDRSHRANAVRGRPSSLRARRIAVVEAASAAAGAGPRARSASTAARLPSVARGRLAHARLLSRDECHAHLKKLIDLGLVEYRRSPADRRSVQIKLTAEGCEVHEIVEALCQKHVCTVKQACGVDANEFATLNRLLHRLERFWTDQVVYRL